MFFPVLPSARLLSLSFKRICFHYIGSLYVQIFCKSSIVFCYKKRRCFVFPSKIHSGKRMNSEVNFKNFASPQFRRTLLQSCLPSRIPGSPQQSHTQVVLGDCMRQLSHAGVFSRPPVFFWLSPATLHPVSKLKLGLLLGFNRHRYGTQNQSPENGLPTFLAS